MPVRPRRVSLPHDPGGRCRPPVRRRDVWWSDSRCLLDSHGSRLRVRGRQRGLSLRARRATREGRRLHAQQHDFALSGISGGSVGFATYAAHLAERADLGSQKDWIDSRLDRDFLSPTVSWTLFVELPQSLLRFKHPIDTAEVLERSWETAWGEGKARGTWRLFELWRSRHAVPLLLLNGTSVEDGCRFNGSVLDASVETAAKKTPQGPAKVRFHDCRATGPFDDTPSGTGTEEPGTQVLLPKSVLGATRDLADFVCGRSGQQLDVPLATVAILSARFPYVSPSGRVERRCPDDDQGTRSPTSSTAAISRPPARARSSNCTTSSNR